MVSETLNESDILVPTKQMIELLPRGGDRAKSVYRWKRQGYISPAEEVEGKGRGHSDKWSLPGIVWCFVLDVLFGAGLTTETCVYPYWKAEGMPEGPGSFYSLGDEGGLFQSHLQVHDYDVVIQMVSSWDEESNKKPWKKSTELRLTPSEIFLKGIEQATTYTQVMTDREYRAVTSVTLVFAKQIKDVVLKQLKGKEIVE